MAEQVKREPSAKRVRAVLGAEVVADSYRPELVWEHPYFPTYYFSSNDIQAKLFETGAGKTSPRLGDQRLFTVKTGVNQANDAAYAYSGIPELVAFRWSAMDHWFEEDEEVYVHARDPYKRIDTLTSSRRVEVLVNGTKVADSNRPVLLFETGLPTRYYLPKTDVRLELLERSDTRTECPYKGVAEYWSIVTDGEVFKDVVWSYPFPVSEAAKIAGLVAFYNEKVDMVVDGTLLERPRSPSS
ncbi:MAG TPA: DUF427 domain-containing protein [Acidimicrobiia bacterium]|nr:DUF427 domain-containing protein [Acidimicrobiia bacterium]